jgi:hypothetical protein
VARVVEEQLHESAMGLKKLVLPVSDGQATGTPIGND